MQQYDQFLHSGGHCQFNGTSVCQENGTQRPDSGSAGVAYSLQRLVLGMTIFAALFGGNLIGFISW